MSSTYNGNPASGAWTPPVSITEPADLDTLNAASVNPALSALANHIAFLQANAGQKGGSNTWTAAQVFAALVTLTGNVQLTAAVAQTLLKTAAGGLTVGTAAGGGDLLLSANGVTLLKLLATGSLDAQAKILGNLADPVSAQDAATKAYVDSPLTAWTALSQSTNWSTGALFSKDRLGVVRLRGVVQAANSSALAALCGGLPAGARPAANLMFPLIKGVTGPTYSASSLSITTAGVISVVPLNGAAFSAAAGDAYWLEGITFYAG